MIRITIATTDDIALLQQIGKDSFYPTYLPIISAEQVDFMFEMMYSNDALTKQMQERGDVFLIAFKDDKAVGFAAFQKDFMIGETKLHKLYVLPKVQAKGVGKALLNEVELMAQAAGQDSLVLNVNRYNKAVGFYNNQGYKIFRTDDIDIGNGYFMNDYELKKSLA